MPARQSSEGDRSAPRPVDPQALERIRRRLAAAPQPPWLHTEVARRMAERLAIVKLQPLQVLDWWAQGAASRALLQTAYPRARIVPVQPHGNAASAGTTPEAAPWWSPRRWSASATLAIDAEQVPAGAGQLLWANMMLHAVPDPAALFSAWHRALAIDGFVMFSTLGPGSLTALRQLYRAQGWPAPFAPFVDMHDLGDMLVQAGFADPVMDQEQLELSWPDAEAMVQELRTLGGNADGGRFAGLRTPRWRDQLVTALAALAGADGRPRLVFELVYGHAFRPPPRPRLQAETAVAVEDLRAMARRGAVARR